MREVTEIRETPETKRFLANRPKTITQLKAEEADAAAEIRAKLEEEFKQGDK